MGFGDSIPFWVDGDPWRDLLPEIEAVGAATFVSANGSARFIDLRRRRHLRIPLEAGHRMTFDGGWLDGYVVECSPCGLVIEGTFWARGTNLRLPLPGLAYGWPSTAPGRMVVDAVIAGLPPICGEGHPPEPCLAIYCYAREPRTPLD